MKAPLILSLGTVHPFPDKLPLTSLMAAAGHNIGNLLFSASVQRVVANARNQNKFGFRKADLATGEVDGLVIAAANWLQPKNDFSGLCRHIEATDLPVVITGLGAQAINEVVPELQPGTLRFIKVLSERASSLSVRGSFTAEVLNHYGIKNAEVTGCPSLLWHVDRPARVRSREPAAAPLSVGVTPTLPGQTVPKNITARMALAQFILRLAMQNRFDVVAQTELPLQRMQRREATVQDIQFLNFVFGVDTEAAYENWIKDDLKVFGIVGEWIAYCAQNDLNIGMRLHGAVAGLLSGTPTLLITHDARTREMATTASIPALPGEDLINSRTVDAVELLDRAEAGMDAFNARQITYYSAFKDFFDRNGVPTKLKTQ